MFIDADKRESIERWFTGKGYRNFNEYVIALIDEDMGSEMNNQIIAYKIGYSDQTVNAHDKLPWEE